MTVQAELADPIAAFCARVDEAIGSGKPDLVADDVLQLYLKAAA